MSIGERIKQLRGKEARKSFCAKLGIAINTLINYENNARTPDAKFIGNLCSIYNVTTDWLILGKTSDERKTVDLIDISHTKMANKPRSINELGPQITSSKNEWILDLSAEEFEVLVYEYWRERKARRGWLQVEVIKRFPEFLEWLESRLEDVKTPSSSALKGDAQSYPQGLPWSPPES